MKPTKGRIVWVTLQGVLNDQPAIITKVHTDDCVNVTVFDDRELRYVTSLLNRDVVGTENSHWRWPDRE